MKKLLAFLFFFFCLSLSININAQEHSRLNQDLEYWNKLSLSYKLNKKISFKLNQNVRFKNNASTLKVVFTEAAVNYKLNKRWNVGLGYRIIFPNEDLQYNRFHVLGRYRISPKKWDFNYRIKLDNETEDFRLYTHNLRNRLTVGYNFKKWKFDPQVSAEIFYNYQYDYQGFNKLRLLVGTEYDLNKKLNLELSGGFQRTFNVRCPKQTGIVSLTLNANVNKIMKKAKKKTEG